MKDYIYDGTFDGFLTCVYFHYYKDKAAHIYPAGQYQLTLPLTSEPGASFGSSLTVETDPDKAARVYRAIEEKISPHAIERVYKVLLSNVPDKEMVALNYIRLGFKEGGRIANLHSHPIVLAAQQTERKVGFEVHRLCGLVRFSVLGRKGPQGETMEILYSPLRPDHDVLELLADHFTDRFKEEAFIIHDIGRGKALFAVKGEWYIGPLNQQELPEMTEEEEVYRKLWKCYFETIAIRERTNPKCQRNFMPRRYWENLTELR